MGILLNAEKERYPEKIYIEPREVTTHEHLIAG